MTPIPQPTLQGYTQMAHREAIANAPAPMPNPNTTNDNGPPNNKTKNV